MMNKKTILEELCKNIENTLVQLRENNLIRDENGISQKRIGKNLYYCCFLLRATSRYYFYLPVQIRHLRLILLFFL